MIANTRQTKNIFEELRQKGHDIDFEPRKPCQPTGALKGTIERLEVYRLRVLNGEELHHPMDEPLATKDGWEECIAFCRASIRETKAEKQAAALEKAKTFVRSKHQEIRNASAKRARQKARERDKKQRVTVRIKPAPNMKHPDVIDS